MPDIWFDVDIALSEVPVNLMPLLDSTDFVTRETAVAYNATGMDLVWNFVTTGGAFTQTAVTPTTAGDYDWTHQGDGMYTIEIPASGGASINNDTEGFGWFSGLATGVLPWRGPVIGFRAAALNNALIDGGDNLDVNVTQWAGTATTLSSTSAKPEVDVYSVSDDATAANNLESYTDGTTPMPVNATQFSGDSTAADNAELFFDGTGYNAANSTIGTCTTNTDMRGTDSALLASAAPTNFSDLAITATTGRVTVGTNADKTGYSISGTITTLDALDTAQDSQHSTTQSAIAALNDLSAADVNAQVDTALADYDGPTNAEMVAAFTEIKGATWSSTTDTLEAIIDRGNTAWITATGFSTLDAAGVRTAVGLASANLDTQLLAIVTDTGELQTDWTNGGRLDLILDAVLAMLDDPRSEPGQGNPAVNPDAMTKIDYLYKAWRNKKSNDGTDTSLYADDGTTVDQKQTTTSSGGTVTKTEWVTGP